LDDSAPAVFDLPEVVRFDNAVDVRLAGERFLDGSSGAVRIGLAALRESNSIVVAVLLAWVRHAAKVGRSLRFHDVPADLRKMIELYGVASLLPIEGSAANGATPPAERNPRGAQGPATSPEHA